MSKVHYSRRDEILDLAEEILSELSEIKDRVRNDEILSELSEIKDKVTHLIDLCEPNPPLEAAYSTNDFDDE